MDNNTLHGMLLGVSEGDELSCLALSDYLEDHGEQMLNLKVGEQYLFETARWYYLGRISEVSAMGFKIENAVLLHWIGDMPTLLESGDYSTEDEVSPIPDGATFSFLMLIGPPIPFRHEIDRKRTHEPQEKKRRNRK